MKGPWPFGASRGSTHALSMEKRWAHIWMNTCEGEARGGGEDMHAPELGRVGPKVHGREDHTQFLRS